MALTTQGLADDFRRDLADPELPGSEDGSDTPDIDSLWSNADIAAYLNEAQIEVARRARALRDVLTITIVVGTAEYTLPDYAFRIREAHLNTVDVDLDVVNKDTMDAGRNSHDDYGSYIGTTFPSTITGQPFKLIDDEKTGKFRLYPKPVTADTLSVHVYRIPKNELADLGTALELTSPRYRRALLCYMKFRAYEKDDSNMADPKAAQDWERKYEVAMAQLVPEEKQRFRRAGTVRYGGL